MLAIHPTLSGEVSTETRKASQEFPGTLPGALDVLRPHVLRRVLALPLTQAYADLRTFAQLDERPVVVIANHICLLDSALLILACEGQGRKAWLAAAQTVLDRFPPLQRLGAFAVSHGSPVASARQLREIAARAKRSTPGRAIVIFPEGGHVRPGLRADVRRGALALARASGAPIIPVALHYELFERARPFAYLRAVEPVEVHGREIVDLREVIDCAQAQLMRDLLDGTGSYQPLLRPRAEISLVANVPLDRRRFGRSQGPLYRHLQTKQTT